MEPWKQQTKEGNNVGDTWSEGGDIKSASTEDVSPEPYNAHPIFHDLCQC